MKKLSRVLPALGEYSADIGFIDAIFSLPLARFLDV